VLSPVVGCVELETQDVVSIWLLLCREEVEVEVGG
jgi:hypothetical protein